MNNHWFWVDIKSFGKYHDLNLQPFVIWEIGKDNCFKFKEKNINLRNNHLEYTITWFSLAVIIGFMTYLYSKKKMYYLFPNIFFMNGIVIFLFCSKDFASIIPTNSLIAARERSILSKI